MNSSKQRIRHAQKTRNQIQTQTKIVPNTIYLQVSFEEYGCSVKVNVVFLTLLISQSRTEDPPRTYLYSMLRLFLDGTAYRMNTIVSMAK